MANLTSDQTSGSNQTSGASANRSSDQTPSTTSPLLIAVAWLWVGLPLAWGVIQTISKTMDLFR